MDSQSSKKISLTKWAITPFLDEGIALEKIPGQLKWKISVNGVYLGTMRVLGSATRSALLLLNMVHIPSDIISMKNEELTRNARRIVDAFCCVYCGKKPEKLRRCSVCMAANYCASGCQGMHWSKHSRVCATLSYKRIRQDIDIFPVINRPLPPLTCIEKVKYVNTFAESVLLCKNVIADTNITHLLDIPKEILRIILRYSDPCSRVLCREVCRALWWCIRYRKVVRTELMGIRIGHEAILMSKTINKNSDELRDWKKAIKNGALRSIVCGFHSTCFGKPLREHTYHLLQYACYKNQLEITKYLFDRIEYSQQQYALERGTLCIDAITGDSLEVLKWLYETDHPITKKCSKMACIRILYGDSDYKVAHWLRENGFLSFKHARRMSLIKIHDRQTRLRMRSRRKLYEYIHSEDCSINREAAKLLY